MSPAGERTSARVELKLLLGVNPIQGTIRSANHAETGFSGWLDLVRMLERICSLEGTLLSEQPQWGLDRL